MQFLGGCRLTTESHFLRSLGLNQNRRNYGDSSLILDSLELLSEKPTALAVGSSHDRGKNLHPIGHNLGVTKPDETF